MTGQAYGVWRWCCTSGHCTACQHLPRGERVWETHVHRTSQEKAEMIRDAWRSYGAVVAPADCPPPPPV